MALINVLEDNSSMHALISYRAIVAGLLVALFTMAGLTGLGLAFGGIGMDAEMSIKAAGLLTGVWFIVSVLVSLFVGSYFAARVSRFRNGLVGSLQGLVIASLFIGFILYQLLSALSLGGLSAGAFLGKNGSALSNTVNDVAEDAFGNLNLKSDPQFVAQAVGARILRGDIEAAKSYLAREAGITLTEADARIAQLKNQADKISSEAKEATVTALRSAGWSLFLIITFGALAAFGGGTLGSAANFRRPLVRIERDEFVYP